MWGFMGPGDMGLGMNASGNKKGRSRKRRAMLLSTLSVMPLFCLAQNNDNGLSRLSLGSFVDATSLELLGNMVVTDTKIAQSPDSVTQKLLVLRQEDIARQPELNRNLAELLTYTSGQFVNVLSRNDANWGSYAGLGPKYNTYLLDGLPMDSFVDAMSLDKDVIERIEVQKGPASVLYSNYLTMDFAGNETPLAGTTNFVLKSRVDSELSRFSFGAGSWGTWNGKAYTQGRKDSLSYVLGAGTEKSGYTQYGTPGSWLQTTGTPDYAKSRLFGNFSYELGRANHTLSLLTHFTRQDGSMGRPNRDFRHEYATFNLSYNNQISDNWHVQFKAGERRYDREFANDNYPAGSALTNYDNTRQVIRPLDLTASYAHGQNSVLTVGWDHQSVHYWTQSRSPAGVTALENDATANSDGYFLQEKLRLDKWVLRAGLRHDSIAHNYSLLGTHVPDIRQASWSKNLWSTGVRYNLSPGTAFYANAGSSFTPPSAKQIGGTVNVPTASGELANPDLKPESGIGRDMGLDWQASESLLLGARAFLNTIGNAIVSNVVNAAPSQTRSVNAGDARALGLELDVQHSLSSSLSWFGNTTWTRTRVTNPTNPDQDGTSIPFTPDRVANLGLNLRLTGGTSVSTFVHWVGNYYDSTSRTDRKSFGKYGTLNVRLQQQMHKGLELALDLNNVTNSRHDLPFDFRDPGFNAFASLTLSF